MKTIIIHKHDNTERHISIEADAEDTAFMLDMLGLIREDAPTQPAPEEDEPTLQ